MPVDALPPTPPILVDATTLPTTEGTSSHRFAHYRVHVLGDMPISKDEMTYLLERAPDVDTLVAALSEIAHARADKLGRMHVAVLPGELILMWQPARIASVVGTEGITPYFDGFADAESVDMGQVERRRLLSSVHADRASLHVRPQFRAARNGDLVLAAYGLDTHKFPGYLSAGYTNAGNRFVGENFFDIQAGTRTHGGTDISLTARTATGSESDNAKFREVSASLNRVAPVGIVDVSTRLLSYETEIQGVPVEGAIQSGTLSFLQVLSANGNTRTVASFGVTGSRESLTVVGLDSIDQEFVAAELDIQRSRQAINSHWRLDGGLGLIYPLASNNDSAPVDNDWAGAQVNAMISYEPRWRLRLALEGQAAKDVVPNAQQWSLGGAQRMAAFRPGALVGDYGYHGRFSIDTPTAHFGRASARLSLFAEYASVGRNVETSAGALSLSDAGMALSADWRSGNQLRVTTAVPIDDADGAVETMSVFVSARIGFN